MRFLKDDLLSMKEINCDSSNILERLSAASHGSDIYIITPEQYNVLKDLKSIDLVRALKGAKQSEYETKKIGLFNKYLIGSPLVLFDKQDKYNTRSFSFIFENKDAGIDTNQCEIVDNYPDICNLRDIAKYHTDNALYTDTPLEEIITSLINSSTQFYHVTNFGFLMKTTPKEYELQEQFTTKISKGMIPIRRTEITKDQAFWMLDEMCSDNAPTIE